METMLQGKFNLEHLPGTQNIEQTRKARSVVQLSDWMLDWQVFEAVEMRHLAQWSCWHPGQMIYQIVLRSN